jgi:uncharacterized repeat protein (TIGR01451 family)
MNTSTVVYTITAGLATATSYTGLNFGFIQSGNIFQPNGQQTTVPGAFATYTHQYTSVTGGTVTFTETPAVSQPNYFTETLYTDKACSGSLLSANATSIAWGAPQTIAPGGGILCIIVKENVTPSATYGMSNAVTLTSTFNYGTSVANTVLTLTDITTIDTRTSGELQLVKSSYIDTGCTNPANPTYLVTTQSASSTQCIKYQIQATNSGAAAVANVVINDSAPPFTTLVTGTGAAAVGATGCTGFTVGTVTSSASPTVSATFTGSMPAGCVATFVYEVRLN